MNAGKSLDACVSVYAYFLDLFITGIEALFLSLQQIHLELVLVSELY